MARKKSKGGSKPTAGAEQTSPANEAETSSVPVAETSDVASPERATSEVSAGACMPQNTSITSTSESQHSGIDALRLELEACKAQIAELEAQNAALSEENQRLKSAQTASLESLNAPAADTGRQADMETLTQRIATLKAEQAEADAAREIAWSQLKAVVADIARLAAPDAVMKTAGTPSTPGAAGFGAA